MKSMLISMMILGCTVYAVKASEESAGESESRVSRRFEAKGPSQPVRLDRSQLDDAITVSFDLLPTSMSFDLPWNYCMVTENGIKVSNFAAETYDPRDFDGTGARASFEAGMDEEGRYVRAWIEHQSDARIVVRIRYALCNDRYDIAHSDIPSGSPYGKGDWADEWFYIYPDSTHTRHMRIYTGLASMSRPFGFNREPPKVVHEFMESVVIGRPGNKPIDDIDINALTLIRLIGDHTEDIYPEGLSTRISYKSYPEDFGNFRDANIMFVHLKSKYRPFTIGRPYGTRVQPYKPEGSLPFVFQTWDCDREDGYIGYEQTPTGKDLVIWLKMKTDHDVTFSIAPNRPYGQETKIAEEGPQYLGSNYTGAGQNEGIVATASSTDDTAEATNTINGSGLNGEGHDSEWDHTWTSDGTAGNPPAPSPNPARGNSQWIYYDLGRVYS
jgi:hypothetical protein